MATTIYGYKHFTDNDTFLEWQLEHGYIILEVKPISWRGIVVVYFKTLKEEPDYQI